MRTLSTVLLTAGLLFARDAAADAPPGMPFDCSTETLRVPEGVKCVDCVFEPGETTSWCSLNADVDWDLEVLDGGHDDLGYTEKVCDESTMTKFGKYRFQVWCDGDISSSGGCATGHAGSAFDAGLLALMLGTAAYVRWARRRR